MCHALALGGGDAHGRAAVLPGRQRAHIQGGATIRYRFQRSPDPHRIELVTHKCRTTPSLARATFVARAGAYSGKLCIPGSMAGDVDAME